MILITKQEAAYLNKHGVPFGYSGISRTVSGNSKYYLCGSRENKKLLNAYRKSKIITNNN